MEGKSAFFGGNLRTIIKYMRCYVLIGQSVNYKQSQVIFSWSVIQFKQPVTAAAALSWGEVLKAAYRKFQRFFDAHIQDSKSLNDGQILARGREKGPV